MHFLQWFKEYPHWNTIFWLALIGVGAWLEIEGVAHGRLSTFTDLIRRSVPTWIRAAVLGLLVFHFLIDPVNYK